MREGFIGFKKFQEGPDASRCPPTIPNLQLPTWTSPASGPTSSGWDLGIGTAGRRKPVALRLHRAVGFSPSPTSKVDIPCQRPNIIWLGPGNGDRRTTQACGAYVTTGPLAFPPLFLGNSQPLSRLRHDTSHCQHWTLIKAYARILAHIRIVN